MINKLMNVRNFLIIGLCFSLTGCAHTSNKAVKPFVDPQYGMTRQQMVELFGRPDTIEIYRKSDQTKEEFYIYVKKYQSSQINVPVCLVDNKVIGWGKTFYEDHVSSDEIRIK
ncbi:MAG: DUF3192 domain-containing protein [Candidatus Omnitrophica bacterium]|nr:DUF3192 domain-containing protein [Candidatus Omnitrophota bacterium]